MKLFTHTRTVAGSICQVGAWMEDSGALEDDEMYAALLNRLNRYYYDFRGIRVTRKTPAEIGGVFESFGTYAIEAYANKRGLLSRIWQRIMRSAPVVDQEV